MCVHACACVCLRVCVCICVCECVHTCLCVTASLCAMAHVWRPEDTLGVTSHLSLWSKVFAIFLLCAQPASFFGFCCIHLLSLLCDHEEYRLHWLCTGFLCVFWKWKLTSSPLHDQLSRLPGSAAPFFYFFTEWFVLVLGSPYVTQAGLQLTILLPQCWDYGHVAPHSLTLVGTSSLLNTKANPSRSDNHLCVSGSFLRTDEK